MENKMSNKELFIENLLEIVNEYETESFDDLLIIVEDLTLQLIETEKKYNNILEKLIEVQGVLVYRGLEK